MTHHLNQLELELLWIQALQLLFGVGFSEIER